MTGMSLCKSSCAAKDNRLPLMYSVDVMPM